MCRLEKAVYLLLWCCLSTPLLAQEEPVSSDVATAEHKASPQNITAGQPASRDLLDKSRDYLGDSYISLAEGLDFFIARNEHKQRKNNSQLSIRVDSTHFENAKEEHDISVRARIHLPGAEERLHVFLETDPDENDSLSKANRPVSTGERVTQDGSVAGVTFVHQKAPEKWRQSLSLGGRYSEGIKLLVRYRLRKNWQLGQNWRSRAHQDFWYQDGIGWGETSHVEFSRAFAKHYLFNVSTQFQAKESEDPYEYANIWRVDQRLNEDWNLTYKLGLLGNSDEHSMLDDRFANVSLGYRFNRQWVYAFLTPEILYAEENNHKPEPSITLSFEFGIAE